MRLIDAEKMRAEAVEPCKFCHLNGSKYCREKCETNALMKLIDNAPTVPTQSQKLGCEICTNRNIKSKEACTSPFGECEFFNATPRGEWIKIFENPFTNGYICPFCGHKIQVTEQFLPKVTECEVCGAELKGGSET